MKENIIKILNRKFMQKIKVGVGGRRGIFALDASGDFTNKKNTLKLFNNLVKF